MSNMTLYDRAFAVAMTSFPTLSPYEWKAIALKLMRGAQ